MASVAKREWTYKGEAKTAWVVRYTDHGGNRRMKTFPLKKEADRFRTQVEAELAEGKHLSDAQTAKIRSLTERYIRFLEHKLRDGKIVKATFIGLKRIAEKEIAKAFGHKLARDVSFQDIEAWRDSMVKRNLAPGTVRDYLAACGQFARYLVMVGCVSKPVIADACRELGGGRRTRIKTFTAEEVQTLLRAMDVRVGRARFRGAIFTKCVVSLAAFCGMRFGEIMGLTLDNLDLERRLIKVRHSLTRWDEMKGPKTRAGRRDVPMPVHVAALLAQWLEKYYVPNDRRLVFRSMANRPIYGAVWHAGYWHPLLKKAGLNVDGEKAFHFHALRHFSASWMIENGLPLTEVASLLGHSTFDMTLQVYAHPIVGGNRRHDAIDRMANTLLLEATR